MRLSQSGFVSTSRSRWVLGCRFLLLLYVAICSWTGHRDYFCNSVFQLNTVVIDALAFLVGARPEDRGLPHYPIDGDLDLDSLVASLFKQVGRFLI